LFLLYVSNECFWARQNLGALKFLVIFPDISPVATDLHTTFTNGEIPDTMARSRHQCQ